jgi:L-amino acid N-acyltransferase YncA
MNIRSATIQDAKHVADIYNFYIQHTTSTFEIELVTENEMASRISTIQTSYPFLVSCVNDQIVGYAYAARWKSRPAYDWALESSIYLKQGHEGKGYGTKLYTELLRHLKAQDIKTVIGGIALPNQSSIVLHEKLGFKKIGEFERVGYKHQKWVNVGYWQLHF